MPGGNTGARVLWSYSRNRDSPTASDGTSSASAHIQWLKMNGWITEKTRTERLQGGRFCLAFLLCLLKSTLSNKLKIERNSSS